MRVFLTSGIVFFQQLGVQTFTGGKLKYWKILLTQNSRYRISRF
jgi:hypothetical protein